MIAVHVRNAVLGNFFSFRLDLKESKSTLRSKYTNIGAMQITSRSRIYKTIYLKSCYLRLFGINVYLFIFYSWQNTATIFCFTWKITMTFMPFWFMSTPNINTIKWKYLITEIIYWILKYICCYAERDVWQIS